ncbi:MAG TPA: type IV pilus biogenesis/stability protein PilW, partial [Casimicrobiaceae bacterium]|nr:type IV pilus biogenesis/stability protein PilW [Casimicrobiaceae bacterium]
MKRLASALLVAAALALAACASKSPTAPVPTQASEPEPPPVKTQEATPQQRAQIRTELAAGYYERGQMDIALEELGNAKSIDPSYPK